MVFLRKLLSVKNFQRTSKNQKRSAFEIFYAIRVNRALLVQLLNSINLNQH